MIGDSILIRCSEAIKKIDPSAEIILYGSRARGDNLEDSDYDFLVIIDGEATTTKEELFREQIYPIELDTARVLTLFAVSRSQWNSPLFAAMPFYQNVRRDGIPL